MWGYCYPLPKHVDVFNIFPNVCMLCVNFGKKQNSQHLFVCFDDVYVSLYRCMHSTSLSIGECCTFPSECKISVNIFRFVLMLLTFLIPIACTRKSLLTCACCNSFSASVTAAHMVLYMRMRLSAACICWWSNIYSNWCMLHVSLGKYEYGQHLSVCLDSVMSLCSGGCIERRSQCLHFFPLEVRHHLSFFVDCVIPSL